MQIIMRVPLIIKINFYQQETENSLPLWMSKAKHEVYSINSNSMSLKKINELQVLLRDLDQFW